MSCSANRFAARPVVVYLRKMILETRDLFSPYDFCRHLNTDAFLCRKLGELDFPLALTGKIVILYRSTFLKVEIYSVIGFVVKHERCSKAVRLFAWQWARGILRGCFRGEHWGHVLPKKFHRKGPFSLMKQCPWTVVPPSPCLRCFLRRYRCIMGNPILCCDSTKVSMESLTCVRRKILPIFNTAFVIIKSDLCCGPLKRNNRCNILRFVVSNGLTIVFSVA